MTTVLNYRKMRKICLAPFDWFKRYGHVVNTPLGRYIYKDNGTHILAVAHLDSVNNDTHFYKVTIRNETVIYNSHLDDRLGAYIILDLLPSLGITMDILLTEGEEIGRSTAHHFKTTKKYKWMVEFDRHGDDVALYKYKDNSFGNMLRKVGFNKQEWGSFTDICELGHLGCRGFNVSIGYDNEHSPWCSADMSILQAQVAKFCAFYKKYGDVHIPFAEKDAVSRYQTGQQWGGSYQRNSAATTASTSAKLHEEGDFAYYDAIKKIAYRYDANGVPRPETPEETAWWKKDWTQEDKMDEKADAALDAILNGQASFVCMTCGIEKDVEEMSDEWPDICKRCGNEVELCVSCQKPTHNSQLDEYEMCKICHDEAQMGNGRMTQRRCPVCGSRLFTTELLQNTCWTCKRSSHGNLPAHVSM